MPHMATQLNSVISTTNQHTGGAGGYLEKRPKNLQLHWGETKITTLISCVVFESHSGLKRKDTPGKQHEENRSDLPTAAGSLGLFWHSPCRPAWFKIIPHNESSLHTVYMQTWEKFSRLQSSGAAHSDATLPLEFDWRGEKRRFT